MFDEFQSIGLQDDGRAVMWTSSLKYEVEYKESSSDVLYIEFHYFKGKYLVVRFPLDSMKRGFGTRSLEPEKAFDFSCNWVSSSKGFL